MEKKTIVKALGYFGAGISALAAFSNALSEQKKAKEFEDLKKQVAELQKK